MWKRQTRPASKPISKKSIFFALFIAVLFWATVGALVVEAVLFGTGNKPITSYVRGWVQDAPVAVIPFILAFGVLIGHFFWGPREGAATPEAPQKLRVLGKEIP